ncbi:MAG: carboxypeptidase-like regulatory domain-containing protein, partial [Bacteroidota bacterium]
MRLLLAVVVVVLLLASPPALAQETGKLVGIVTDDTGEPLPGANVVLDGTKHGAATDIDGAFVLLDVPPGTYDVTASFVGFERRTQQVVIAAGAALALDFALPPDRSVPDCHVIGYWRPFFSNDPYSSVTLTAEKITR